MWPTMPLCCAVQQQRESVIFDSQAIAGDVCDMDRDSGHMPMQVIALPYFCSHALSMCSQRICKMKRLLVQV